MGCLLWFDVGNLLEVGTSTLRSVRHRPGTPKLIAEKYYTLLKDGAEVVIIQLSGDDTPH